MLDAEPVVCDGHVDDVDLDAVIDFWGYIPRAARSRKRRPAGRRLLVRAG